MIASRLLYHCAETKALLVNNNLITFRNSEVRRVSHPRSTGLSLWQVQALLLQLSADNLPLYAL